MRVISVKPLRDFWRRHRNAEDALKAWFKEAEHATWTKPADLKKRYGTSVDFLPNNRVVFDIKGNTCRLIVRINYDFGQVFIRFVGTHAEYDKINAEEI